jgi:putative transcriptional regulator
LLTQHSPEGSLGFILNKPTSLSIGDAIENFPCDSSKLFFGGPVETDSLFYIHTCFKLTGARKVADGIYFGGDFDELKQKIKSGEIENNSIRYYAGYAGWDSGQLHFELKEKSWIISPPRPEIAFLPQTDRMWENVLKSMGQEFEELAYYPEDPNLN